MPLKETNLKHLQHKLLLWKCIWNDIWFVIYIVIFSLSENIVYQATVKQSDGQTNTYIGLTAPAFKKRFANHKKSFKDQKYSRETKLSTHLWNLKEKDIKYDLEWRIMARAKPFCPVKGVCQLRTMEKFFIIFRPESSTLNSRNEINTNCPHKLPRLLTNT